MNERIKLLAEQCYVYNDKTDDIWFNKEKFAELIVRECISFRDDLTQFDGTEPFGDGYEQGLKDMADSIKEHFGVEE
jgi:hypothetical protein